MFHLDIADGSQHGTTNNAGCIARSIGQFAGLGPRQCQKLLQVAHRHLVIHREYENVSPHAPNRREIIDGVIGWALHQRGRRAMRAIRGDHHRMAIRRGAGSGHRGNRAIGTRAVIHHHLRSPFLFQKARQQARNRIGPGPGGKGHNQRHRA